MAGSHDQGYKLRFSLVVGHQRIILELCHLRLRSVRLCVTIRLFRHAFSRGQRLIVQHGPYFI